ALKVPDGRRHLAGALPLPLARVLVGEPERLRVERAEEHLAAEAILEDAQPLAEPAGELRLAREVFQVEHQDRARVAHELEDRRALVGIVGRRSLLGESAERVERGAKHLGVAPVPPRRVAGDHEVLDARVLALGAEPDELVAHLLLADRVGEVGERRADVGGRQRKLDEAAQRNQSAAGILLAGGIGLGLVAFFVPFLICRWHCLSGSGYQPQRWPLFCSLSQAWSGAKYSRIALASICRVPVSASSASGHGLLAPMESIAHRRLPASLEP